MPAVGSHDNMTSTDRVLFSKGDSIVAQPAGEIADCEKQLDNGVASRAIGPRSDTTRTIRALRGARVEIIERNFIGNI